MKRVERPSNRLAKRIFDVFFASIGLLIASPFLLIIAALVAIENQGSVIFANRRIGLGGKSFPCYKFRTMYMDSEKILEQYLAENPECAEEWRIYYKLKGFDPRVTKTGKWLRQYSLDELPQLLNVMLNHMSIVGPRPYLPREKDTIGEALETITQVKPGITGYWQVNGRSETTFAERISMDVWYVKNCLFKTVKAVLKSEGAY